VFVQWKQPTDRHPTTFKAANQQPVGATSNYAVLWSPAASGYFNTYLDGSQSAGPIPFSVSPDTAAVVGEVNDAASQMPGDPFGDAEVFTDAEISYTEGPPSTKR
jgi:hypothetical protein